MKRSQKLFLTAGLVLALFAGGTAYYYLAGHSTADMIKNPIKTSATGNKILPVATGKIADANITPDTGGTEWVKVKSTGHVDEKVANLSTSDLVIYRIHSPKVLKTATSVSSPGLSMDTVIERYPKALIMNASGFDLQTYETFGLQINRGTLFSNWGEKYGAGLHAFVINKDGSTKLYGSETSADTIIKNGAEMSFSYGSIVIKNGQILDNDGSLNWKYHSLIGTDKNNNIYTIITLHMITYADVLAQLASLNLTNLIVMDGGGSSQLAYNGQTIWPSEDSRLVPDYIVMK